MALWIMVLPLGTCGPCSEAVDDHNPTSDLARLYQDLNSVRDFVLAFPMGKSGKRKASSEGTTPGVTPPVPAKTIIINLDYTYKVFSSNIHVPGVMLKDIPNEVNNVEHFINLLDYVNRCEPNSKKLSHRTTNVNSYFTWKYLSTEEIKKTVEERLKMSRKISRLEQKFQKVF
ncbi:hypothetical protein OS493_019479 [Desmophyllum pertusum]|uniref:Uncharacterized protein n=1 Tax=Desmophyllum pertusum TaxID=174260 RepID=A0A9W9ZQ78_9CNID|nr:hypothetical protein OS493_019479 [Desmophyllum pertusum]